MDTLFRHSCLWSWIGHATTSYNFPSFDANTPINHIIAWNHGSYTAGCANPSKTDDEWVEIALSTYYPSKPILLSGDKGGVYNVEYPTGYFPGTGPEKGGPATASRIQLTANSTVFPAQPLAKNPLT